ncbi:protein bric-a-brac 2-like isoform X2 [Pseudomyrmex gracilis]|uniref:protein bric-a-brac 2-like isoform X2 n=1 Tax=Pseudomyrmex gracilis TaxID=219809 RepID=UPI000994B977|nr:protein bric-a-brac 2-like isoform X2 [Pseudomyrmex gracilis]
MSEEQFSLVWNSFPRNLSSGLYTLLADEQLVDVTLAAEGQILRAHKLILSVCSTYFRDLFKGNSCKHPIVILKDVNYRDLSAMLHFMYQGEVNIKQEDIASFLKVAETLQIKGLTAETDEKLEEGLRKNVEDFEEQLFEEKDKSTPCNMDENDSTFDRLSHTIEKRQSTKRPKNTLQISTNRKVFVSSNIHDTNNRESCIEDNYNLPDTPSKFNERCRSMDKSPRNTEEQPLDCTSDVNQLQEAKQEPLDYTLDMDTDQSRYKSYTAERIFYDPKENIQKQGLNNATFQNDITYDTTNPSNKIQSAAKDIPSSSLPLETTLRVISELGPTLRMERGKVVRMYACPWCLRHFTRKENLKLHVRYIHGPLETLTCTLCGNKYKNSNSLRVHSYLYHNAKRDKHGKPLTVGSSGSGDGSGNSSV